MSKYLDPRDNLSLCCGRKPEINDFGDHSTVKCIFPSNGDGSCRRTLWIYEQDWYKIVKLWNFIVTEEIGVVDLRREQ